MKTHSRLGLLLIFCCACAWGKTAAPQTCEEWMQRGEDIALGRVDLGIKDADENDKQKHMQSAQAYERAAVMAGDAAKGYWAWDRAGMQWSLNDDYSHARDAYMKARDLPGITTEQRKAAALSADTHQRKLADSQKVASSTALLRALDSLTGGPDSPAVARRKQAVDRANGLEAKGDYKAARTEVESLLAQPELTPDEQADVLRIVARISSDEFINALKNNAEPAVLTNCQKDQAASLDKVLALRGVYAFTYCRAVIERAQIALDMKQPAEAHKILQDGRSQLYASVGHVRQLWSVDSQLYRSEQEYSKAMVALSLAAVKDSVLGPRSTPDKEEQELGGILLNEAFATKKWDDARAIISVLELWGLVPTEALLFRSQIDMVAGQPEVARARLKALGAMTLTDDEKKKHASLLKKLPPERAGAVPAVVPPAVAPPKLTEPPPPPAPVSFVDDDDY